MPGLSHRARPPREDYRYLETAGPADLAWEWLRRDPDFRRLTPSARRQTTDGIAISEAASPECEARWGCLHVPDPDLRFTDTPILWSADIDPSVLRVIATPASEEDGSAFDLRRWAGTANMIVGWSGRESLLLYDATRDSLRIDVDFGSLLNGPVTLYHDFSHVVCVEAALLALRRYLCLCRAGELPTVSLRGGQRLRRQIQALRVHDTLIKGASIRDVGVVLFGVDRVREEWPGQGDALKSQCRRMIALSRYMVSGGYRTFLR